MAGLYVHVPFCLRKCPYCAFYSTGRTGLEDLWARALKKEMDLRAHLFDGIPVRSVYFGGGTPSLLPGDLLAGIMDHLRIRFMLTGDAEISLEANPATADSGRLSEYRESGVNRISIGVQSFRDDELRFLGRLHSARDAEGMITAARDAGFDNIGIDLIFGMPGQTGGHWSESVEKAVSSGIRHLSAYCLELHPGTPFEKDARNGTFSLPGEELLSERMLWTDGFLKSEGFVHYEISNYAKPGYECRHNMGYWKGDPYLGLGPSAHSCAEDRRSWNGSDVERYIDVLSQDRLPDGEAETLTDRQKQMERISLGLRLSEGIPLHWIPDRTDLIARLIEAGYASETEGRFSLTPEGGILADEIAAELA